MGPYTEALTRWLEARSPVDAVPELSFCTWWAGSVRAGGAAGLGDRESERTLVADIEEAAKSLDAAGRELAALACVHRLEGRVDEAIDRFVKAAEADPLDPRIAADLAEALLTRYEHGRDQGDPEDLLTAAETALAFEPEPRSQGVVEALHGRLLERLGLGSRIALAQSAASPVTAAERGDSQAIRAIVQNSPGEALERIERAVRSRAAGDHVEMPTRETLRRIAGELERRGEGFALAMIEDLDRPRDEGDIRQYVIGAQRLSHGLELLAEERPEEAIAKLGEAAEGLRRLGSPLAVRADHALAVGLFHCHRSRDAKTAARRVLRHAEELDARHLMGRALWLEALTAVRLGHPEEALGLYRQSEEIFRRLGDEAAGSAVESLMGEALDLMGERSRGWRYRLAALGRLPSHRSPRRLSSLLDQAGLAAAEQGYPRVALGYRRAAVAVADRWGEGLAQAYSRVRLSEALWRLERRDEAESQLRRASAYAGAIPDAERRDRVRAEIDHAQSKELADSAPAQAVVRLDSYISYLDREELSLLLAGALRERATMRSALHQPQRAEKDLQRAIGELERQNRRIESPEHRHTHRTLVDELHRVRIAQRRGDPLAALQTLEESRAREAAEPAKTAVLADLAADLRPGTEIIHFAVLEHFLLVGAIAADGPRATEVEMPRDELCSRVEQFARAVRDGTPRQELSELSTQLWSVLLGRVAGGEVSADTLVLIPDDCLHDLPFAALVSPGEEGRYLVERARLAVAESGTDWLRGRPLGGGGTAEPYSMLIVDPPASAGGDEFPPLTWASTEAEAVAAGWGDALRLTGRAATPDAFSAHAPAARCIHVAAHAVSDRSRPFFSSLRLASGGEEPTEGWLFGHEIAGMDLRSTRLAVLAACSTSSGTASGLRGRAGLGAAFLQAGAGGVLATQWSIADRDAAAMMPRFWTLFASGASALDALRQAQLERITSDDPFVASPAAWAGYVLLGGSDLARPGGCVD